MRRKTKKIGALAMAIIMAGATLQGGVSKAYTPKDYSIFNDYSIGWKSNKIAVYQGSSSSKTVQAAGLTIYNKYQECDDPFVSENKQAWDADTLILTQPVRFTTSDGVVHDVDNMLTGFDFIADPTAIDNTDVDGKLYVYGTTEGFSYGAMSRDDLSVTANPGDELVSNKYQNHSLTILSTSDMVNWTDEGFMDSYNLTNLRSDEEDDFVKSGITNGPSWAPSGLRYSLKNDGTYKYYLFYTNGGSTGYVMSDSPTGPWEEPEGGTIFSHSTPNCSDCNTCFDPAVLVDDKNDAYIYFGGLTRTSGRACKIKFNEDTGRVERDGDPVKLPTYAMFEDNEINQFNGKYYYSYCTDWTGATQPLTKAVSIAVYVSSDPLNVSFDVASRPKGQEFEKFTDENGVERHFLGTVLDNPSTIFGEGYNNHHHMQEFKGHKYIFYHSTLLHNTLHRINNQYRNLHVDEITVDPETDAIEGLAVDSKGNKTVATYEGPEQIEAFNPYFNNDKSIRYVNATTSSSSAGVKSTRDDEQVTSSKSGSPMVLDSIETGDWIRIQGVDFTDDGLKKISAEVTSATDNAAIEMFIDDPTKASNLVATIPVKKTGDAEYVTYSADIDTPVTGNHDVYFVFRGEDYKVASWKFDNTETLTPPATQAPATQAPTQTPATVTPTQAPAVATQAPAQTVKTMKLSSVKCTKNSTKVTGKVSVSGTTVKVKVGSKAYKKATVKGKKFTAKVAKLKKKAKVTIKVTKKGYKTLIKTFKVK